MLIRRFMRLFFSLLYHPFAFTYDWVAALVSFGEWKDWGRSVLPFIEGTSILELGHGPGHLQRLLLNGGLRLAGVDESAQMGRIARRRIGASQKLTRAVAQSLPFQSAAFDCVISTFPSDYIFDPETLAETKRALRSGGRFIVLPAAWPKNRLLKWLFRVTGESPSELNEKIIARFSQPFVQAGFRTEINTVEVKSSKVIIIIASLR